MIAAPRLHPADAVGTRLHVGDLVQWRQSRDRSVVMAFAENAHPDVLGPAVLLQWQDDRRSYWRSIFDLELTYLVPESRHDRIVRMSHVRPQVVRVEVPGRSLLGLTCWVPAWAAILSGRAYVYPWAPWTSLLAEARSLAENGTEPTWGRPDDGTWRIP